MRDRTPDQPSIAFTDADLQWFSDWWRPALQAAPAAPLTRAGSIRLDPESAATLAWFEDWWRVPSHSRRPFEVVPSSRTVRPAHDLRWFQDWWAA